jgi:hypothetical protein
MRTTALPRPLDELVGALSIAGTLTLSPALSRWYRRWGATGPECAEALPGDALVPAPRLQSTRAVDIDATPEVVWSWLVQIGHGRAGLYSYEALENLIGCDIHNAEEVVPAWQSLSVGDRVALGPAGYPSFAVVEAVRPERLVLLASGGADDPRNSWSFVVRARGAAGARLVVRSRYDFPRTLGQRVLWRALTEPMHFVMERRMLLGLKERAERAPAA